MKVQIGHLYFEVWRVLGSQAETPAEAIDFEHLFPRQTTCPTTSDRIRDGSES